MLPHADGMIEASLFIHAKKPGLYTVEEVFKS
jgi:hypothetical protein